MTGVRRLEGMPASGTGRVQAVRDAAFGEPLRAYFPAFRNEVPVNLRRSRRLSLTASRTLPPSTRTASLQESMLECP
jgi:hypothetical protein